jgi:hypothetical protein
MSYAVNSVITEYDRSETPLSDQSSYLQASTALNCKRACYMG